MKKLLILIFLLITTKTFAATRTIATTGGNYSSIATWVENIVPTSADDVIATSLSGQLTIDVASAAKSIDFTNYTNTLTINAVLTVSGNVKLVSAMTIAGSSALKINATATLTSNTKTWPNALTLTGNGITYTLADAWTVTGTLTLNDTNNGSTQTINGFSITISGGLSLPANNNITQGTTNLILNGTGTWSMAATANILKNNLTINTAGTITISGTVTYGTGSLVYTAGTVTTTGSTLIISGSLGADIPTGITWATVKYTASLGSFNLPSGLSVTTLMLDGSTTYTLGANLTISGGLTLGWNTNGSPIINAFILNVGGGLSCAANSIVITGTTEIILNGTGTLAQTGGATTCTIGNNLTINTAGTITVSGNVRYSTGTLKYTAGTVTTTSSTLTLQGATTLNVGTIVWNNITIAVAGTYTLSSALKFSGTTTGQVAFTTAGTGVLTPSADATITLLASNITTINGLSSQGSSGHNVIIQSSASGTKATLFKSGANLATTFVSVKDLRAEGTCFTATSSTNTSGNLGWIFAVNTPVCPTGSEFGGGI